MNPPVFQPGFRFSPADAAVLVAAVGGVVIMAPLLWWAALVLGTVILHFFLFCNVFRISRKPELIWAFVFTALSGATLLTGAPGWLTTVTASGLLAAILIFRETRTEHYHGIFWRHLNPGLPAWWESRNSAIHPSTE